MDPALFTYTGALDPQYHAHLYVQRPEDTDVREALRRVGRECVLVSLIGARQTGKTSLLNALAAECGAAGSGWVTLAIDLSELGEADGAAWYRQLAAECLRWLARRGVALTAEEIGRECAAAAVPPDSARGWMLLLSLACQRLPAGARLLLLLDEVGSVPRAQWEHFFSTVRALHQAARAPTGRPEFRGLGLLLAGAFVPAHLINDPDRSPFNVSTKIYMSQAGADDLAPLLRVFAEHELACDDAGRDALYRWSGGLLYHAQRLCAEIAASGAAAVTPALVDACAEAVSFDDAYLSHILRQLRGDQALASLARVLLDRPLRSTRNINDTAALEVAGVIRFDPRARAWTITNRLCAFALQQHFAAEGAIIHAADEYSPYEHQLRALLERLGQRHPRYAEALTYQQRLGENITRSRFYGDTADRRADRAEILARINHLAMSSEQ